MTLLRHLRTGLAVALTALLATALLVVMRAGWRSEAKTHLVAYFANTNGLFAGDEIRVLGAR